MESIVIVLVEVLVLISKVILHTSISVVAWNAPVRRHKWGTRLLLLCTVLRTRLAVSVTIAVLGSLMTIPICGLTAMMTRDGCLLVVFRLGCIRFRLAWRYGSPAQIAKMVC